MKIIFLILLLGIPRGYAGEVVPGDEEIMKNLEFFSQMDLLENFDALEKDDLEEDGDADANPQEADK
jgi:hypothetical protein